MQVSLRGHRIKYILMGFTGSILSIASLDKIEALENTERNSFSWYFSVISLLKSNYSFFFSQILSIYTWIEENHGESFKASDRIKSYDLFKIHLV